MIGDYDVLGALALLLAVVYFMAMFALIVWIVRH